MTVMLVGVSARRILLEKRLGGTAGQALGGASMESTAKTAIFCSLPRSKREKFSFLRSATGPFLSWTTTETCTSRVVTRMVGWFWENTGSRAKAAGSRRQMADGGSRRILDFPV